MSTHNIPFFNMKMKNTLNYPKSAVMGFFPRDSRTRSRSLYLTAAEINTMTLSFGSAANIPKIAKLLSFSFREASV